ncbi:MAG TPA: hypothetical protein VHP12_04910 [Chitinophagaceae bacterium]|nr:hypothetical protein [Chitinophagaceae bacterium]
MKKNIFCVSFLLLCMPFVSLAHPGHGETDGYTIIHYFTEPMHAVFTYSILIATVVYIFRLRRNSRNKQQSKNI